MWNVLYTLFNPKKKCEWPRGIATGKIAMDSTATSEQQKKSETVKIKWRHPWGQQSLITNSSYNGNDSQLSLLSFYTWSTIIFSFRLDLWIRLKKNKSLINRAPRSVSRTMTHHHPRLTATLALLTSHTHARTLAYTPRKKTVDNVCKIRDSQSKKGINRDNNVAINVQI